MVLDLWHGIGAVSPGGAFIKWTFISEVVVAREDGKGEMMSYNEASKAVEALKSLTKGYEIDAVTI